MLTINRAPDFIQFTVEGVYCINCQEFTPGALEVCIGSPIPESVDAAADPSLGQDVLTSGCGSSAVAYVEAGSWLGGLQPSPGHPCTVEHDLSSGMIAYTKMTAAELDEKASRDKAELEAQRTWAAAEQAKADRKVAARELLRLKAAEDPMWAAMADLFDVDLEA